MENIEKIAIIIPAYKADFFEQTLESIAQQTCKAFTVYIGDDASPYDIRTIADKFNGAFNLVYKRFDDNLGSKDLVSHWERCMAMAEDEEWIYLFSDDDIMPKDAIERIHISISRHPDALFFRFQLAVIDEENSVLHSNQALASGITSAEVMLTNYLKGKNSSAACEYIFNRKLLMEHGFIHFPVAWCSDVATWYLYAKAGGVVNITGYPVFWRNAAGKNISNNNTIIAPKAKALSSFIIWLKENWPGKADRKIKRALARFIRTNLRISFNREYDNKMLYEICKAYSKFDFFRALVIYIRHIK